MLVPPLLPPMPQPAPLKRARRARLHAPLATPPQQPTWLGTLFTLPITPPTPRNAIGNTGICLTWESTLFKNDIISTKEGLIQQNIIYSTKLGDQRPERFKYNLFQVLESF
jgi:hypothetical protein